MTLSDLSPSLRPRRFRQALSLALLAAGLAIGLGMPVATACGPDTDCVIGDRTYRVRMPEGHDGVTPVGAIVFMHGYRGSAAGTMRNAALGAAISELGLALVAPKSYADDWAIPGVPQGSEPVEIAFFDDLLEDVTARFPIDPGRIMATGFSAGGMMVWNLACERGDHFAGFAPIAGTFWAPVPDACPSGPVHLIHTHGTSDEIVPLAGRPIQATAQGDVYQAVEMLAATGGYGDPTTRIDGSLACERRTNPDGMVLELCLHPGGHSLNTAYVVRAWRALEALGALD